MSSVIHGGLDDAERRPGVIDLSANLHPDGPPAAVTEALRAAAIDRYPSVDARPLREALAAWHGVDPACVVVTPGASAAIYLATAALLPQGDACAVFDPTFGEYARAVEAAGGVVRRHVAPSPYFALPADAAAPFAWLCIPNNPTGLPTPRTEADRLLGGVRHLLIDAAYADLAEDGWGAVDLVRSGAPVTVVGSLTKLFAMPGVRLGYLLAAPAVAARIRDRQPPWPVGAAEIAAGVAAIAGIEERLATVPSLHARRRLLEAAFIAQGISTTASTTNFVLARVGSGAQFRERMLERGVGVRDAASFGLPEWARIAVPSADALPGVIEAITDTLAARE